MKKPKSPSTIGQRIAARRKELGISQRELSERCGLGNTAIFYAESGGNLSARSLMLIAIALETSMDFLATGKKNPESAIA